MARTLGKFLREFRRQTDDVKNLVEREFYKMDQQLDLEKPLEAAPPRTFPLPPGHSPPAPAVPLTDPGHDEHGRLIAPPAVAAAPSVPSAPDPVPAPAAGLNGGSQPPSASPAPEPADPKTGEH